MKPPIILYDEPTAHRERVAAEKYGPKVRWLRQGARLTGRELCRRVGVTPSYLSDIEVSRRLPSPEVSDRIADALSVDRDALWRLALLERLSDRDLAALRVAEKPAEVVALREAADYAAHVLDLWLTGDEDFTEQRVRDTITRVRAALTPTPEHRPATLTAEGGWG